MTIDSEFRLKLTFKQGNVSNDTKTYIYIKLDEYVVCCRVDLSANKFFCSNSFRYMACSKFLEHLFRPEDVMMVLSSSSQPF